MAARWDISRPPLPAGAWGWIPPGGSHAARSLRPSPAGRTKLPTSGPAPPASRKYCHSTSDHLLSLVIRLKQIGRSARRATGSGAAPPPARPYAGAQFPSSNSRVCSTFASCWRARSQVSFTWRFQSRFALIGGVVTTASKLVAAGVPTLFHLDLAPGPEEVQPRPGGNQPCLPPIRVGAVAIAPHSPAGLRGDHLAPSGVGDHAPRSQLLVPVIRNPRCRCGEPTADTQRRGTQNQPSPDGHEPSLALNPRPARTAPHPANRTRFAPGARRYSTSAEYPPGYPSTPPAGRGR